MHRYAHMRQACGSKLLKTVELSCGKQILYPYLTSCYLSLKQSPGLSLLQAVNGGA